MLCTVMALLAVLAVICVRGLLVYYTISPRMFDAAAIRRENAGERR